MIGSSSFATTPIRSDGGHGRPFEETERWIESLLDLVPITRVYDATPLDSLGLPVWAAVTPLARDLTVHAGKGASAIAAKVSAMMEAIERVSAEAVDPQRVRIASFSELKREDREGVLDPALCDLPFQTVYRPDVRIAWVDGYDLMSERRVWVPLDLAISPAREGVCTGVETNGLASGNSHPEAVVHALHEVIERDASATSVFSTLYADPSEAPTLRLIDRASLPPNVAAWIEHLSEEGITTTIQDLTHDIGVPVFRATISDSGFPGRDGRIARFEGLGCDLDAVNAVSRAVLEAAQSHTAVFVGARDTFEGGEDRGRRGGAGGLIRQLLWPSSVEPFGSTGTDELPSDLSARLLILLKRMERVGLTRCVCVSLERSELGVPVVRVLVPGAAGPYTHTTRRPSLRLLRSVV